MTPIVIYHSPCQDGFTAAWAAWKAHPDWEFYPARYGDPAPLELMADRDVYLLDFTYKRPILEKIARIAKNVIILDHHKTAEADLSAPFDKEGMCHVTTRFDMEHSGAYLAWDWFHYGVEFPEIIKYVEDRDLWRFKHKHTKALSAYMFACPYDFKTWDILAEGIQKAEYCKEYINMGEAILDNHSKFTDELANLKYRTRIAGHEVWAVNVPYNYSSDMGALLSKGEPFVVTYFYDGSSGKTKYSLRSDENGLDVSEIAKRYGGGGHKHAAGFELVTAVSELV